MGKVVAAEFVKTATRRDQWPADPLPEIAFGDESKRVLAVLDEPQADAVRSEQRDRVRDDVLEEDREVQLAADVGCDPTERIATRDLLVDELEPPRVCTPWPGRGSATREGTPHRFRVRRVLGPSPDHGDYHEAAGPPGLLAGGRA